MKRRSLLAVVALLALVLGASTAFAINWVEWKAEKFGYRMEIPKAMVMKAKDFGDGWGGYHGTLGPVHIYGVAKLGAHPDLKDMQAFGIKLTGIPAGKWTLVNQGTGRNGFTWHKTYRAKKAGKVVFAALAHAPKGAYVVVLATNPANFQARKAAYRKWYGSIHAF